MFHILSLLLAPWPLVTPVSKKNSVLVKNWWYIDVNLKNVLDFAWDFNFHVILVVHCFWQSLFERIWNNDVTMAARDFSFLNFGARLEEALQVANSVDVNKSMLRWTVAKASILFSIVPFTSNFFLVGRSLFVSVVKTPALQILTTIDVRL